MDLGRRFACGELIPRFTRAVGRTSSAAESGAVRPRGSPAGRASGLSRLATRVRELGPHAAIALFVPGGSLIALAMWAFRYRTSFTPTPRRLWVVVAAVGAALILPGNL